MMNNRKPFYDLASEDEKRIKDAEQKHHEAIVIKELAAIREATQSLCALIMGLQVRS